MLDAGQGTDLDKDVERTSFIDEQVRHPPDGNCVNYQSCDIHKKKGWIISSPFLFLAFGGGLGLCVETVHDSHGKDDAI